MTRDAPPLEDVNNCVRETLSERSVAKDLAASILLLQWLEEAHEKKAGMTWQLARRAVYEAENLQFSCQSTSPPPALAVGFVGTTGYEVPRPRRLQRSRWLAFRRVSGGTRDW